MDVAVTSFGDCVVSSLIRSVHDFSDVAYLPYMWILDTHRYATYSMCSKLMPLCHEYSNFEINVRFGSPLIPFGLFSYSCPFDYVKVFDGPDNSSALIGTYCGQQRNLVLYSSESSLLVHFFTLRRTASTQNRGFKGIYEFSEGFVKLDFIRTYPMVDLQSNNSLIIFCDLIWFPNFFFVPPPLFAQVKIMVCIFVDLNATRKFYQKKNHLDWFIRQTIHFHIYLKRFAGMYSNSSSTFSSMELMWKLERGSVGVRFTDIV